MYHAVQSDLNEVIYPTLGYLLGHVNGEEVDYSVQGHLNEVINPYLSARPCGWHKGGSLSSERLE